MRENLTRMVEHVVIKTLDGYRHEITEDQTPHLESMWGVPTLCFDTLDGGKKFVNLNAVISITKRYVEE